MNYKEDAEYRKRLAEGFLHEARFNLKHQLWRSCVDNSQLSIENSGKMIIALFEPAEKSHNPSYQLKRLVEQRKLSDVFEPQLRDIIAIFDDLVKSQKSRHSCESRSPELLELTGFPLSRE